VPLVPLEIEIDDDARRYGAVSVDIDRGLGAAFVTVHAPTGPEPSNPAELLAAGASAWLLTAARQLDDAILRLRFNEPEIGTWVLRTEGDPAYVVAAEELLAVSPQHWLVREIRLYWSRTLKRLDHSARTLVTLIEPGSCFAGLLTELALAADRSFMLEGTRPGHDLPAAQLRLTAANDGWFPMSNGLSRLASRFWGDAAALDAARAQIGKQLLAAEAADAGLVTFAPDEIDWDDEVRLTLEERAAFSPDALTGMEANLRFAGPETMETKVFGRLSAWQNWIFQRPNAVGREGALRRFGTGSRPSYDRERT
jgi:benzoyl-CoA-dihydrodiol lyase